MTTFSFFLVQVAPSVKQPPPLLQTETHPEKRTDDRQKDKNLKDSSCSNTAETVDSQKNEGL